MKFKKILALLTVIVTLFCFIPFSAFAAVVANPMENTNVTNDLKAMGYDLSDYPKDPSAKYLSVISFLEYGYAASGDLRYYGLYLYLYNPSGVPINVDSAKLQLAYVPDGNQYHKYGTYSKYALECTSVSLESNYEHLFYKFKVSLSSSIGRDVNQMFRQYRLSGVEFKNADGKYIDYPLQYEISYGGYQEGFGKVDGAASTLFTEVDSFETVEIDLFPATWKSNTSDLGTEYRYELSSVYFNIPNYFINKYGNPLDTASKGGTSGLYAVRGMYDKYVTNGLVVPDQTTYDWFSPIVGVDISKLSGYEKGSIGDHGGFYNKRVFIEDNFFVSYNMKLLGQMTKLTQLCTLMIDADKNVSHNEFYEVYQQYKNDPFKLHNFSSTEKLYNSSGIFTDLGVNKGYYITVEDGALNDSIKSWASANGRGWLHQLFNKKLYVDEAGYPEIKPIVELVESDFSKDASKISEKYFVTAEDAEDMKTFVKEYKSGNHLYLMRLDVNPYYAQEVVLTDDLNDTSFNYNYGLYFEKVVYENVDVLEFTFQDRKGGKTVVPVNCDPVDIVGSIVSPDIHNPNNPDKELLQKEKEKELLRDLLKLLLGLIAIVAIIAAVLWVLNFFGISPGKVFAFIGRILRWIWDKLRRFIAWLTKQFKRFVPWFRKQWKRFVSWLKKLFKK